MKTSRYRYHAAVARISFAGTHRTGKTTLIEALAGRLRGYEAFEEPYLLLEEDGYEFSDPPTVEDFEHQLRRSIELLDDAPANALFDRCPLDFVAYAAALGEDLAVDDAIRDALETLDLLVFVPIESHIVVGAHEDQRLRTEVDERLRALVVDDALGLGLQTLEVTGSVEARVQQVIAALR